MKCKCKDWKENIDIINGPIRFIAATRPHMSFGEIKPFLYCPWCGRHLSAHAADAESRCEHEWGIDGVHQNEYCKKCFTNRTTD